MKKKIAILTQPLGHNYGGIIQNYALQYKLKELGYDPITIDRQWDTPPQWRVFGGKVKDLLLNRKVPRYNKREIAQITKHTTSFIDKHIKQSEVIENQIDFDKHFKTYTYDIYLVGSDQVWRPKYSPNIFSYYLDFLEDNKAKRITYAASFGTAEWEYTPEQTKVCKALAQKFDAISVREDSGVDLCKTYFNVNSINVMDPTLLLTSEDYSKLINIPKTNKGLFTYVLDKSEDKQVFISDISKVLNIKHHTNQAEYNFKNIDSRNLEFSKLIIPPLEGWLQGFRDAEFIITDSFHGTVFAIINKKPFISLVNVKRGASRFESFLSQLGLRDRLVYNINDFDKNLLTKEIDYEMVYSKLTPLIDTSLSFLKNNLSK